MRRLRFRGRIELVVRNGRISVFFLYFAVGLTLLCTLGLPLDVALGCDLL